MTNCLIFKNDSGDKRRTEIGASEVVSIEDEEFD